jgi:phosphate starvation-inducible PhoH-like protein
MEIINMASKKPTKRVRNNNQFAINDVIPMSSYKEPKEIKPRSVKQRSYLNSIEQNIITIGIGCAGVGKSHIALSYAAQQLELKNISKVIITRPIVEAGEKLGFLPGELGEKTAPYMLPMLEILNKRLGKSTVDYYLKRGIIEFKPLAYLRGTTFDNAIVILDEAQNCSESQMRMFLTRIGEDVKVIIDGDLDQQDTNDRSGLADAIRRLVYVNNVGIIKFDVQDIVRSGIAKEIVMAYMR